MYVTITCSAYREADAFQTMRMFKHHEKKKMRRGPNVWIKAAFGKSLP